MSQEQQANDYRRVTAIRYFGKEWRELSRKRITVWIFGSNPDFWIQEYLNALLSCKSETPRSKRWKTILSAPFTFATRRLFPSQPASGCREILRTRFGKFQSHADDLRLRNTPLLSSARRTCKELNAIRPNILFTLLLPNSCRFLFLLVAPTQ